MKWTQRQQQAISHRGGSILVSAAAGSGKTAVLAERCADLVCDPKAHCDVTQLLVVTFTESAAGQMKSRIRQSLAARYAQSPTERLRRQLALVEHASVGTLHAFCARMIRQNFNRVGLDPEFRILDEDEAILLQSEVAEQLFDEQYEVDESGDFQRLIDCYGDGRDQRLMEKVIQTHDMLRSLADPQAWIGRAIADAEDESKIEVQLREKIVPAIDHVLSLCRQGVSFGRKHPDLKKYEERFMEIGLGLSALKPKLDKVGLDTFREEVGGFGEGLESAPPLKEHMEGKDHIQSLLTKVKGALKKSDGEVWKWLGRTLDEWKNDMRMVAPHAKVFLKLVQDFGAVFEKAKRDQRAADFSDLEHYALAVLKDQGKPSAEAKALHRQYRHVLVDEYQDINELQDEILRLLSSERVDQAGNLFCVGDVKQSIFRFRLAEPERFLSRRQRFAADPALGTNIDLRENFRSRGALLSAVNEVFTGLMSSSEETEILYDQSHALQAGRLFPPDHPAGFKGAPITVHILPDAKDRSADHSDDSEADGAEDLESAQYEAIAVAREIRRLIHEKRRVVENDKPRPIEYRDIVILLRAMKIKSDVFADILRAHGIPVFSESGSGFFDTTEIRDMLSLLEILDNRRQDIPLAAVLRSPIGRFSDDDLAAIRLKFPCIPFHEAVLECAKGSDELAGKLGMFLTAADNWRQEMNKRPVADVIWTIYQETGYLAYCGGLDDGEQRVANLLQLHERAGQFGTFLRQGLYRFLKFLQTLRGLKDLPRPPLASGAQHVRIMSIHRSKGLEFPVVILPDLGKRHNLTDANGAILADRAAGLGMDVVDEQRMIRYPSLASLLVRENIVRQSINEELRLLYVALTRAKEHVICIGTTGEKYLGGMARWKNHNGPIPPADVHAGKSYLSWLIPIAMMCQGRPAPAVAIEQFAAETVKEWKNPRDNKPVVPDGLVNFQPLPIEPPANEEARQTVAQLSWQYPFETLTKQPAAKSVTSLARKPVTDGPFPAMEKKLDLPEFFAATSTKASDIGNATHLVLQHWDFSRTGQTQTIEAQINELLAKNLISIQEAKMVNRESIEWMLNHPIGKLLADNHDKLRREIPFAMAVPENQSQGEDRLMVRGRIDLLLPDRDGWVIVDYKTDNVSGAELENRRAGYAQQMSAYRTAMTEIGKAKITGIKLVFLTARVVLDV